MITEVPGAAGIGLTTTVAEAVEKVVLWHPNNETDTKFKVWFNVAPGIFTVASPLLFKVINVFEPAPVL